MNDNEFGAYFDSLRDRLFPTEERDGPTGDVPVDARFLRDLIARYGGCRLWNRAYRDVLRPFKYLWDDLTYEASEAESVGHEYPLDDDQRVEVRLGDVIRAVELLEASHNARREPPAKKDDR